MLSEVAPALCGDCVLALTSLTMVGKRVAPLEHATLTPEIAMTMSTIGLPNWSPPRARRCIGSSIAQRINFG